MKVVLHIPSGRLVHRELPEPPDARLLESAQAFGYGDPRDLVVIEVAPSEWERELALRDQERPVPLEVRIANLEKRVQDLEG